MKFNIPKEWLEKRAAAEQGDCTTIGMMPPQNTTVEDWIDACKVSNPDASEETVREWCRRYQQENAGVPNNSGQTRPAKLL